MSFERTPGYTYIEAEPPPIKKTALMTQKEYERQVKAYQREHPTETQLWKSEVRAKGVQTAYREYYQKQAEIEQQLAQAQWKQEIQRQYPASLYDVQFMGSGEAQITQRPQVTLPSQPRDYGTLEPEAQMAFKAIEQERAVGEWTAPLYLGVPKRTGGLSEYDVPYNVEALAKELFGGKSTVETPTLFADYMKAKESKPPTYFADYMKAKETREIPVFEQFLGEMTKPRITRYEGYGEREVLGSPVGMGGVTRTMAYFIKTGEATIGEFEEHILKQPTIRSDLMAPEEIAVSYGIIGTVALFKFAPKITGWFGGTRVGQTLKFSRVTKVVQAFKTKLPSLKGSKLDVWLAKKSKFYYGKTRGIAPSEVGLKPFEMVTKRGETLPKIGLGDVKATGIYWEMIQAPRTGGVMIGKSLVTTKGLQTYTLEWILKGGQLIPRFRPQRAQPYMPTQREQSKTLFRMFKPVKLGPYTPIYQKGLLPFVTQKQVTRMGIIPYQPYVGGRTFTAISPKIIGSTLAVLGAGLTKKLRFKPKIQPLEWQPTLAREREKFRTISFEEMEQKQKQALIPMLKVGQLQRHQLKLKLRLERLQKQAPIQEPLIQPLTQPQAQKQETIPALMPRQLQRQDVPFPTPIIPEPTFPTIPPFLRTPRGGADVSRGAKDLFGRWFRREHKIKSARAMWETFHSGPKKRGKAKGKRKRRRRKRKH